MAEQLLDEEKQQILDYVIKNSPYGETTAVTTELKKLINDYPQYETYISDLLVKHCQDHFAIARGHPQQDAFLLTSVNYVPEEGYYLDQAHSKKVFVDHATLTVTKVEDITLEVNQALNKYRHTIEKGIEDYLKNYYAGTGSGFLVHLNWDNDNFSIYVALTSKNLKLDNYHGGEWISDWVIDATSLTGKVRINSHFFEEGNVCLKEIKKIEDHVTFTGDDAEKEGKQIVKQIIAHEQKVNEGLETIYESMSDSFFKNMRRLLPKTNQKMNWDQSVHKLIANLKR